MTVPDIYPPAVQRPVSYYRESGALAQPPLGWVLHVVVGNGSPFGTFQGAVPPNRRFSHLWVSKTGVVEQYAPLSAKSWAQAAGNTSWWSVETEGFPDEPLTDAQLDTLAGWHVWCGAADLLAAAPSQRGIGTHQMGGLDWGGHVCPGAIRAGQRTEILRRATALRTNPRKDDVMALDPAERAQFITDIAEAVTGLRAVHPVLVDPGTGAGHLPDGRDIDALPSVVGEIQHEQRRQAGILDEILRRVGGPSSNRATVNPDAGR